MDLPRKFDMTNPHLITGIDEAGRGPLIGPVFAAAVLVPADFSLVGLTDSKKLTEKVREKLEIEIKAIAVGWFVASASVAEIDSLNILQATLLAMTRAATGLNQHLGQIKVDGNKLFAGTGLNYTSIEAIVKGDLKVPAISAASVLAKVARDRWAYAYHTEFPQYQLNKHKGYGTQLHLACLEKYGVTPEHRRSFAPVRKLLKA